MRRAHYYLGMVTLADARTGPDRLAQASAEFREELKLAPEDPLTNDQLGLALLEAGPPGGGPAPPRDGRPRRGTLACSSTTSGAASSPSSGPPRPWPRCGGRWSWPQEEGAGRGRARADPLPAGPGAHEGSGRRRRRRRSSPRPGACAARRRRLARADAAARPSGGRRRRRATEASPPSRVCRAAAAARAEAPGDGEPGPRVLQPRRAAGPEPRTRRRAERYRAGGRALREGGRARPRLPAGPVLAGRRVLQRAAVREGRGAAHACARGAARRTPASGACSRSPASTPRPGRRRPRCCRTIRVARRTPSLEFAYGLALLRSDRPAEAEKVFTGLARPARRLGGAEPAARPGSSRAGQATTLRSCPPARGRARTRRAEEAHAALGAACDAPGSRRRGPRAAGDRRSPRAREPARPRAARAGLPEAGADGRGGAAARDSPPAPAGGAGTEAVRRPSPGSAPSRWPPRPRPSLSRCRSPRRSRRRREAASRGRRLSARRPGRSPSRRCWRSRASSPERRTSGGPSRPCGRPARSPPTRRRCSRPTPRRRSPSARPCRPSRCWRRSPACVPSVGQYHYLLGMALVQAGDVAAAVEPLKEAERLEPNEPPILVALGTALNDRKLYTEAKPPLLRALSLAPDSVGGDGRARGGRGGPGRAAGGGGPRADGRSPGRATTRRRTR